MVDHIFSICSLITGDSASLLIIRIRNPKKPFQTPSKFEINAVINSDFNMKTSLSLPETASEAGHHGSHE